MSDGRYGSNTTFAPDADLIGRPAEPAVQSSSDMFAGTNQAGSTWDVPLDQPKGRAKASTWDTASPQGAVPAIPDPVHETTVPMDFVEGIPDPGSPLRVATEAVGSPGVRGGLRSGSPTPPPPPAAAPVPIIPGKTSFWQLAHYQGYFDVDTKEVFVRMLGAIAFRRDLFAEIEAKPDLYGPFWLSTTAVFLMAITSNALGWFAGPGTEGEAWAGDVNKVIYAAAIFYGYVFGVGGLLWVWLKVISLAQISLTALWCFYGYSMTVWLPVTFLALIPNALFLWLLCMGASLYSGIFLVLNLKQPVQESLVASKQAVTLLFVFLLHQVVSVLLRLFVFAY